MCIWKLEMENIPYPLPMGGIFEDNNFWTPYYIFIQYLLVWTQDFRTRTINGTFYTVNLLSEKTGCIYLFNSSYLSQGLQIKITLVMLVEYVMYNRVLSFINILNNLLPLASIHSVRSPSNNYANPCFFCLKKQTP